MWPLSVLQGQKLTTTAERHESHGLGQHDAAESRRLPAGEESIDHEGQVGRLLADSCAKVVVPPVADQQQLRQAGAKDGEAQHGTAEDEGKEEPVIPLQGTVTLQTLL